MLKCNVINLSAFTRLTDNVKPTAASASVICANASESVPTARIAIGTSATGSDNGGCR